ERVENELCLERVAAILVLDVDRRNAPAVVLGPAFRPPAIEHAQVETAVERRLDAGRAARLERGDGIVEPHVDAGYEPAPELHVVVLEEHDAADEFGRERQQL